MHSVLAARTNFSIGESILTPEKLIDAALKVGAKAVAITDTMSCTGMIDFTNRAKKAGVKPIIGCRLRLVDDPRWKKTKEDKKAPPEYFVTWYVLSERGLKALFRLLTLANSDERFYNTAKLSFTDLYNELANVDGDDVAIASSDAQSVILHKDATAILETIKNALDASSVFLTLTPINTPYWDSVNVKALDLAEKLELPTLVTRPVFYDAGEGKADAHEVLAAVTRNVRADEMWHWSNAARDLHPLSLKDLTGETVMAYKRLGERRDLTGHGNAFSMGVKNTADLVERVNYQWSKAPVSLPKMAEDEFGTVVAEAKKGWGQRFSNSVFGHKPTTEELRTIYQPRLKYELEVLKKLDFSGYFLLVQDVVQFAKKAGILVGPGRGSVGGSLVAYLLGITDCDPLRFGLLFERFINPDRIDLPDADLDFMSERRHEVVEYLTNKYGAARVAGVSNFLTIGPASAIKDVGKALGLDESETRASKLAPKEHGANVKLTPAADMVAEIGAFRDKYPPVWNVCLNLEGVMRTVGQHAAGIVVGGCDLVERAPIERRKGESVVAWDKRIVEDQGLVKMDILGLSTLDLINLTVKYIRERHKERVDLLRIPLDDAKVLDNFANAISTGIFQFESGGMRRLLKELGKDGTITFEDVTAATALYRPGPMESGMMDSYYLRKQGEESVDYDHPLLEEVLKETYGVFVYQEEVMQASRVIAGYTGAEADKLRKIMGKKLPEEMEKERDKFVSGCVKTVGSTEEWANELFDKIAGFAGYGFNKSHSVVYTLISYQSMWLKTYYPVEFIAAALSLMGDDRLPELMKDAERLGIEVLLPDANLSTEKFEILTDTKLCIPFTRVKGLSEKAALEIVEARKTGKFASLADFEARCRSRMVHKGKIEALDKIGAFASIEPTQPIQRHPDRIKDQRELIPGLIFDTVPVHRKFNLDKPTKGKLEDLIAEYQRDHGPNEEGVGDGMPVRPFIGKDVKFMVITDAPTAGEEKDGMTWAYSFGSTAEALSEAGLAREDGYWTALLKRTKSGKVITAKEITDYVPYLKREIETLKPPCIAILGSTALRQFVPDFKGKASDAAGQVIYHKELDTNIVVGFNPGEIFHAPEKQANLNAVFSKVAELTV